jgi:hypothetical protein
MNKKLGATAKQVGLLQRLINAIKNNGSRPTVAEYGRARSQAETILFGGRIQAPEENLMRAEYTSLRAELDRIGQLSTWKFFAWKWKSKRAAPVSAQGNAEAAP